MAGYTITITGTKYVDATSATEAEGKVAALLDDLLADYSLETTLDNDTDQEND